MVLVSSEEVREPGGRSTAITVDTFWQRAIEGYINEQPVAIKERLQALENRVNELETLNHRMQEHNQRLNRNNQMLVNLANMVQTKQDRT